MPLLWLIVPLSLMVAQLQAFYGYSGLTRGEPALIDARIQRMTRP